MNWRITLRFHVPYYIFITVLVSFSTAVRVCPKKISSVSGDYGVTDRFSKVVATKNVFKITHTHVRDNGKKETYDYLITLCGDSGKDAVLQTAKESKSDDKSLGKIDGNSSLIGGEDWMYLQYYDGTPYHLHCHRQRRETWIYIRCEDQGEKPQMRVIEEARYDTKTNPFKKCFYLFEYNHPEACNNIKKNKLSGGAIFLIVLVSFAAAYLLFGFLYQRFVAHAKGFDQIPNFAFWRKVGNMSADGCDFVCRREEHANTYKGMADALDIDSSDDDDKDDGLLPM